MKKQVGLEWVGSLRGSFQARQRYEGMKGGPFGEQ